ncbi:glutathione S-transferase protein-like protein [Karstenula rhodostoma CBS 690.94]|uniref:Glutathione S-transferase protein-like protein n=1 Tax=Karstenula rhodostoma CBS 690.94 TaxID=1392251 RepID=A0A9P4UAV4_9PLEO|nr:glutathione S-transferase protein-like protein [Karstenula rhodostoma CBS 690.94]
MSNDAKYELLYWPGIPGRGEFVRLAFEATGTPYLDVSNQVEGGIHQILALKDEKASHDADGNPPALAPPALRIHGEGKNGKSLLLSQTPAILAFLGEKLELAGADATEKAWIQALALTALDLNNETHDTHHPVSTLAYYEDQKPEALRRATDFRETRIPKFLGYFERVLKGNKEGQGKYLVGDKLSYADLTLWQVVHGLKFAFPNELKAREEAGEFPTVFKTFFASVPEHGQLKEYLESDRRKPYSKGIFRHYPELDRQ